jgi:hypothetical protein
MSLHYCIVPVYGCHAVSNLTIRDTESLICSARITDAIVEIINCQNLKSETEPEGFLKTSHREASRKVILKSICVDKSDVLILEFENTLNFETIKIFLDLDDYTLFK